MRFAHAPDNNLQLVAQIFNLPYRRLAIGMAAPTPARNGAQPNSDPFAICHLPFAIRHPGPQLRIESSFLVLLWSLEFGVWSFFHRSPSLPSCNSARRGESAFTLAEVLAALVFMAILIPV